MASTNPLRLSRLQTLHAKLLKAAEAHPTLCHAAVLADALLSCMEDSNWQEQRGYPVSIPSDKAKEYLTSLHFSLYLENAGGPAVRDPISRLHLLDFDQTRWYGIFHLCKRGGQNLDDGVSLLKQLADQLVDECSGPRQLAFIHEPWLEFLYNSFPQYRSSPEAKCACAWLPNNVFLISAKAIEMLLERDGVSNFTTGGAGSGRPAPKRNIMDTASLERLWQIAAGIRALPNAFASAGPTAKPGAVVLESFFATGSDLLEEALNLGAFAGAEHSVLRLHLQDAKRRLPSRKKELTFSVVATHLIPASLDETYAPPSYDDICTAIADALEADIRRMEALLPLAAMTENGVALAAAPAAPSTPAQPQAAEPRVKRQPAAPAKDGPIKPDCFISNGTVYGGLARKPFLAVQFLWNEPNRSADTDDLAVPVWEDHGAMPDEEAVRGLRREINTFFRQHSIDLHAKVKSRCLSLCDGPPRPSKKRAVAKKPRKRSH